MRILLAVLSVSFVACGSSTTGGNANPDVCEGVAGCGDSCGDGQVCEAGLFCGTDGVCISECTAGGSECGSGQSCNNEGRCENDPTSFADAGPRPDAEVCASVEVSLQPLVPTVVLVIDRSASMSGNINGNGTPERWATVVDSLVNETDGVVKTLEGQVAFGASTYNARGTGETAPCPRLADPLVAQRNNFSAIRDFLTPLSPNGGTPTAEAIAGVTAAFPTAVDGERIIVLATDGDPDSCASPNNTAADKVIVENQVETTFGAGIKTFVLSVADGASADHVQRVANAGVGLPLDTTGAGAATFYVPTSREQLVSAFEEIIRGARSCELDLNGTLEVARAGEGSVTLNGSDLDLGTGWEVVDEDTIRLIGTACDTFLDAPDVTLQASFPCDVVVIVE